MNHPRVIAFDPATHFGWAMSDGGVLISGVWDLSVRRDESAGMRLIRLRAKLADIPGKLDLVVYEAARHGAAAMQGALVVQAELQGILKAWCEDRKVAYRGYSPAEIKKHATGSGNSKKDVMLARAKEKWDATRSTPLTDDNEADALWLLDLALKEYAGGLHGSTGEEADGSASPFTGGGRAARRGLPPSPPPVD